MNAPAEVWVVVGADGVPIDVRLIRSNAEGIAAARYGDGLVRCAVVRYVRADGEGTP